MNTLNQGISVTNFEKYESEDLKNMSRKKKRSSMPKFVRVPGYLD